MSATLTLQNFCGIDANFEIGKPICMIAGPNGSGKTRIAKALGAVLSSTALPLTGKRDDKKEVIGPRGDKAAAAIKADGALRTIVWPSGEISTKGDQDALAQASIYASGLVNHLELSGRERAEAFSQTFRTAPTKEDLERALKAHDLAAHLTLVWDQIEISGWDAAAKESEKTARSKKGAWGEVTGTTWGERVAETWEPDAKHFPDPAELEDALQQTEQGLKEAEAALEAVKAERAKLPQNIDETTSHVCPWCEKPVVFKFGKLEKVEAQASPQHQRDELKKLRLAIAEADGRASNAQDQIYHHQRAVGAARTRLADASEARNKAKARADKLHREILEEIAIAKICGPAGLRQQKLQQVLVIVNNHLSELAHKTGLPALEINADLNATLGGVPYHRLSRAESWMARAIMQIEIARCDKSTLIILDDLDVPVSPKDRNAILSAVLTSGINAVVMQAAWDPQDASRTPDLAAAGYGTTFWLQPIHEDVVDEQTGEVLGDRIKGTRMRPIAEMRSKAVNKAA